MHVFKLGGVAIFFFLHHLSSSLLSLRFETKDIMAAAKNMRIVDDRHETDFVPMVSFSRGRRHSVLSILVFWVSIYPTPLFIQHPLLG